MLVKGAPGHEYSFVETYALHKMDNGFEQTNVVHFTVHNTTCVFRDFVEF